MVIMFRRSRLFRCMKYFNCSTIGRFLFYFRTVAAFACLCLIVIVSNYLCRRHFSRVFFDSTNEREKIKLELQIQKLIKKIDHLEQRKKFPEVAYLSYKDKKRILVTGGAGFIGSHLVDQLMLQGHDVRVADNFFTGHKRNIEHWIGHENFELLNHDVINPLYLEVDEIYHLASPASPHNYMYNPIKTIKTNILGTINMLGLAKRIRARILLASAAEVYGDSEVHPPSESYWGYVDPIGARACYDESKRVAETMCYAYHRQEEVDVRIARIFNTFGPRMGTFDGRVVSNFILQALKNKSITLHGDGVQTRSFQFVSDLVRGLILLMNSNYTQPVNFGDSEEFNIRQLAEVIKKIVGYDCEITSHRNKSEGIQRRKPEINTALKYLGWKPLMPLTSGIKETIKYFRQELNAEQDGKFMIVD